MSVPSSKKMLARPTFAPRKTNRTARQRDRRRGDRREGLERCLWSVFRCGAGDEWHDGMIAKRGVRFGDGFGAQHSVEEAHTGETTGNHSWLLQHAIPPLPT